MRTIAENANDFADLRTLDGGNCVYVDKTDYFHRLVTDPGLKAFFPRRPQSADDIVNCQRMWKRMAQGVPFRE